MEGGEGVLGWWAEGSGEGRERGKETWEGGEGGIVRGIVGGCPADSRLPVVFLYESALHKICVEKKSYMVRKKNASAKKICVGKKTRRKKICFEKIIMRRKKICAGKKNMRQQKKMLCIKNEIMHQQKNIYAPKKNILRQKNVSPQKIKPRPNVRFLRFYCGFRHQKSS